MKNQSGSYGMAMGMPKAAVLKGAKSAVKKAVVKKVAKKVAKKMMK